MIRLSPVTRAAALLLSGALVLSACGSSDDSGDSASDITVEHAFGETEIDGQAERVATVSWANHDVALALGVVPVGMQFITYGDDDEDGILPWTYEKLEELGATGDDLPMLFDETDGIDFEKVAETTPDLILGAYSGITDEDYTQLSKIAPTVAFPEVAWGTSWRDTTLINGKALDMEDEAQDLVTDVEKQIADAATAHPELEGKTFAFAYFDPSDLSKIGVYTPLDARVQYVEDFGLETPDFIAEKDDGSNFYAEFSAENADQVDADILITYGTSETLAQLQDHPLLSKIPAVKNGAVAVVEDGTPFAASLAPPTPLSAAWGLEDYATLLADAAAKAK